MDTSQINQNTSTKSDRKKIFVGMSGGVDSSVSAALLQQAGYDVTGVFIKVWSPDWLPCDWREERRDAMRVAAHLGIPFLTFDFEEVYKKSVVDYLLAEYQAGRTPNPDVLCNREVKFGAFLQEALRQGADFIATGHYAQVVEEGGQFTLLEGTDKNKDQSYFLWTLGQEELAHTLFPVGHLQKSQVRRLAEEFGLPTAAKADSQGICFLGPVDMKEFLAHYIPAKPGKVLDQRGKIIGEHSGALFFTIGERHGFTIIDQEIRSQPHYIIGRDVNKNTLTVAPHQVEKETRAGSQAILESTHWVSDHIPASEQNYLARFRYRQIPEKVQLFQKDSEISIMFENSQEYIPAGQSLVLYKGEKCLGGGIIEKIL